ncbi:alpha/beta family hydrolase [Sciscionella marina]|uniref:alpha/beta hydrolase family protein n=1 Tax=Sciscionella marina TaxID=508770 RepID=UPI0003722D4B|nr:alpha/beta family hydrolase [Sciscionella marina]
MTAIEIETPHGPARVYRHQAERPRALLQLGHGAGGGFGAPDLIAATEAALAAGVSVAQVEQPYRVAGRRAPAPARQLDTAWLAVAGRLRDEGLPMLFGGRSSGARVACRTAGDGGAGAVLCLAFPEHPPGKPERSRQEELDGVEVPALVVQGERDPFGRPAASGRTELVTLAGDHSLKADTAGVGRVIGEWLERILPVL